MIFELKSTNEQGRSIFHQASYYHQDEQVEKVLNTLQRKQVSESLPPINAKDFYGNTALNLALIQRYETEKSKQREQYRVVKQLLWFRQQSKDQIFGKKEEIKFSDNDYGDENVDGQDEKQGPQNPLNGKTPQYNKALGESIDVNISNDYTLFTPLHWACLHGAYKIARLLLQNGAKYFLPDVEGFYPIDYAGLFGHHKIVKLLIRKHFEHINSLENKKDEISKQIDEKKKVLIGLARLQTTQVMREQTMKFENNAKIDVIRQYWAEYQLFDQNPHTKVGQQAPLMFSPVYSTRMLYWATFFDSVELADVQNILSELEAYPEGPVNIMDGGTPLHAAAQVGNIEKLQLLLSDVRSRYQLMEAGYRKSKTYLWEGETEQIKYRRRNLYPFAQPFQTYFLGEKNRQHARSILTQLEILMQNADQDERKRLLNEVAGFIPAFTYDIIDINKNTPLHIASQYGKAQCIKELLRDEYGPLKTDQRNEDGWMAMELAKVPEAVEAYKEYFNRIKESTVEGERGEVLSAADLEKGAVKQNKKAVGPEPKVMDGVAVKHQLTRREQIKNQLLHCKDLLPIVPPLVLKVSVSVDQKDSTNKTEIVNTLIELLVQSNFTVTFFPSVDADIYYIGLQLDQSSLESEAHMLKYRVKLFGINATKSFDQSSAHTENMFEPFRMKDIQIIMMSRLKRMININWYKEKQILLSVIATHDMSGIADIRAQWYYQGPFGAVEDTWQNRCKKFFTNQLSKTMPLPLMWQFFKEGSHYDYNELSAIKNYFGEKIGFHYAWVSFYTAWLIIPVIGGIAITIYQIITGVDTSLTSLYSLLICIWVTIFIERWKRKSSEICLIWGLSDMIGSDAANKRVQRDNFLGYEYFNQDSQNVEKKTIFTRGTYFAFIMQGPAIVLLLACCIATFFGHNRIKSVVNGSITKDNAQLIKFLSLVSGVVNTVVIMIFDFIYSKLALYFVNLENHKYEDSYERSYVYKLFIFKFINTNISIFYTAFRGYINDGTDGKNQIISKEDRFNELYFLLLGMAATKSITIFFAKHVKKMALNNIKKWWYFRKVRKLAEKQTLSQSNNRIQQEKIDAAENGGQRTQQKLQELIKIEKNNKSFLYKDLLNSTQAAQPIYQRRVLHAGGDGQEEEKPRVYTDFVELNDIMIDHAELDFINERSEIFILFGMATLYSCACPIVPLIALLHNIVDMNMDIHVRYTTMRRSFARLDKNIGPWLVIAQFMAIAAVISNSLLLYFSTESLKVWLKSQMGDRYDQVILLWVIVGVEHGIIIVKEFCAELIDDQPPWVEKALQRVERHRQDDGQRERREHLALFEKTREGVAAAFDRCKELVIEVEKKAREGVSAADEMKRKAEEDEKRREEERKRREEERISREQQVALERMKQMEQQEKDATNVASLGQYLGIAPNEWFGKERALLLDHELNKNMQRRLLQQTFVKIEREIMMSRIGKLFDTKSSSTAAINILSGGLQVICAQCQKSLATLECIDCVDHFCKPCSDLLHSNVEICKNHKQLELNMQLTGAEVPKQPRWKKFEYFNFPVLADNAPYQHFELVFYYLQHVYLDANFIEPTLSKVNLQSLFVDRQYEILPDHQAATLKKRDAKVFGEMSEKMLSARECFNDEELFYMNKIAFYLFSRKSQQATFQQFVKSLSVLQSGAFLQRLNLWLHILCEERRNSSGEANSQSETQDYLTRKQLEELFKFSFMQKRLSTLAATLLNTNQVLDFLFTNGQDKITVQQVVDLVQKNEEVLEFLACLLQYRAKQPPASKQA